MADRYSFSLTTFSPRYVVPMTMDGVVMWASMLTTL